jgi:hypothetical protein
MSPFWYFPSSVYFALVQYMLPCLQYLILYRKFYVALLVNFCVMLLLFLYDYYKDCLHYFSVSIHIIHLLSALLPGDNYWTVITVSAFCLTTLPNLYFFYSYVMLFCITLKHRHRYMFDQYYHKLFLCCFLKRINILRRMPPVFFLLLITPRWVGMKHWIINFNAKCRHLKKITCNGTLAGVHQIL